VGIVRLRTTGHWVCLVISFCAACYAWTCLFAPSSQLDPWRVVGLSASYASYAWFLFVEFPMPLDLDDFERLLPIPCKFYLCSLNYCRSFGGLNFSNWRNKIKLFKECESVTQNVLFGNVVLTIFVNGSTPTVGSYCPRIAWNAHLWALGWGWRINSMASALTRYYTASFLPVGIH
jgi:hypothetical protein